MDALRSRRRSWLLLVALTLLFSGCSLRKLAMGSVANTLASSGDTYARDDDPQLVGEALPFALKTMESVLAETPEHQGLLLAACQGFTQYAFAYVELDAQRLEVDDYRAAQRQRDRALKLYLRARGYCFRALDLKVPGTSAALPLKLGEALGRFQRADVPVLAWTGFAWGAAILEGLDRPDLVVDLPAVRALFDRALELDPDWQQGMLHETLIGFEALPAAMGGSLDRARQHYERALALSGGKRPSVQVSWASNVSVKQQHRHEFETLLNQALAIDPDAQPDQRLQTLIAQEHARILLQQADDLFLDDEDDP